MVEDSLDRLARAGLSVKLFPYISFHSSGLTFCSIGNVNPMLTEFITKLAKFGSRWEFEVQLGVGSGVPGRYPDLPNDYDEEMIEMVKSKNLYTVEGLLTARQDLGEPNFEMIEKKIYKTAEKVFQNSKTELIKSSIKMHGLRHIWDVVFDPDKSWHGDFGSFEESHVLDYLKSSETSELQIHLNEKKETVMFQDIWFTGLPDHHFFGVLVSFVNFQSKKLFRRIT